MTNCSVVPGGSGGDMPVEACGPLFVSDVEGFDGDEAAGETIQGTLTKVIMD